jgi:hypothetical protein
VRAHNASLRRAGCSARDLAQACDECGAALRGVHGPRGERGERCGGLRPEQCLACTGLEQERLQRQSNCSSGRLGRYCARPKQWTMVADSSFNTRGDNETLDLEMLRQPGGAYHPPSFRVAPI